MIITERIRNYDYHDIERIKKLAQKSLKDKWKTDEIIDIKSNRTFLIASFDEDTGERIVESIEIKTACAFCIQAFKVPLNIPICERCLIPEIICSNRGKEGLCGKINTLFNNFESNKQKIKRLIEFLRDCLTELSKNGILSRMTEEKIDILLYEDIEIIEITETNGKKYIRLTEKGLEIYNKLIEINQLIRFLF